MMRTYGQIAVIILLLLTTFSQLVSAGEALRIATCDDYPPLSDVNTQGELVGFDVDIARALCQMMDMTCELMIVPWEGISDGLVAGKYDAIIASMGVTPERETVASFTEPYYRSNSTFVGKPGVITATAPEDVRGKTLVAARDTLQADYLTQTYADVATIEFTDTTAQAFELLVSGKADLVLESDLTIFQFLTSEAGKEFDFVGGPVAGGPSGTSHIAVRKEDSNLKEAFNKAIQAIRNDGTYGKINRKYFPFDVY